MVKLQIDYSINLQLVGIQMKKIVFVSKNNAELVEVPDRKPGAGEVRVQLMFSAVSAGTERAVLTGNEEAEEQFHFTFPNSSGYSGSGVVTDVGEGVTEYQPGDRVMVHGGGHQQVCTVPVKEVAPVPDNVPLELAALVVISGFSLAAVRKAKIELGGSCLVVGLGLLGQFAVQYARISGAYPVIASDFSAERRELAKKLGADVVMDPADPEYAEKIRKITNGGVNSAIEVTGNARALKQTLSCTAKFGRVLLLGCTRTMTEVDFYNDVHRPGIELIGAHSGARPEKESHSGFWTEMDDCRVTLRYLSAGRLDFQPIVSEIHSPAEAHEVYERLAVGKNFPIGVLFDWSRL